jgi:hypothetical protein
MSHLERHLEKIVAEVRKRVPEAELEATEERLPRWSIANRAAWLEYSVSGKLLISGTKGGGSTVTVKHKRDESAAEAAATITELLVEPVAQVEEEAERPV